MVDEPDVAEKVELFEAAMLAKIADGWLVENFNLEEALKPPPAPTPPPNDIDRGEGSDNSTDDDPGLSTGALIGIIVAILACFVISAFLVSRFNNKKSDDGEEFDLERHQSVKGSDVGNDGLWTATWQSGLAATPVASQPISATHSRSNGVAQRTPASKLPHAGCVPIHDPGDQHIRETREGW